MKTPDSGKDPVDGPRRKALLLKFSQKGHYRIGLDIINTYPLPGYAPGIAAQVPAIGVQGVKRRPFFYGEVVEICVHEIMHRVLLANDGGKVKHNFPSPYQLFDLKSRL